MSLMLFNILHLDFRYICDNNQLQWELHKQHLSGVLISLLSLTISQVYHFFARKYGLLLRGAITSKYTFLGKNLIFR